MKGFIKKIDKNMITFVCAEDWHIDPYASEPIPMGNTVTLKLPIKKEILDKAVALCTKYLEFKVEDGQIIDLKELEMPKDERPETEIDIIMTGKLKSLRDKLQVVLKEIIDMEKEMGFADEQMLLENLEANYQISKDEAKRLISYLVRNDTIFYSEDGKIKKV